jgi:hypothetical protein
MHFILNDRFVRKKIVRNLLSKKKHGYWLEENGASQMEEAAVALL